MMKQTIIFLFGLMIVFSMACKNDSQTTVVKPAKKTNQASSKTKEKKKYSINAKSSYWVNLRKNIDISSNEVSQLKVEANKVKANIRSLTKQNSWKGERNKKTRIKINIELEKKQLAILGEKNFKAKKAYDKFYKKNKKKK